MIARITENPSRIGATALLLLYATSVGAQPLGTMRPSLNNNVIKSVGGPIERELYYGNDRARDYSRKPQITESTQPFFLESSEAESTQAKRNIPTIHPETVPSLIAWINFKTGWTITKPPKIRFLPPDRLLDLYCGNGNASQHTTVRGLYEIKTMILYLPNNWNPGDLRDRSTLLHELVHHLQVLNNVKVTCLTECDRQSYQLQIDWLREQGIRDPFKFLEIDKFTFSIMTQCPDY